MAHKILITGPPGCGKSTLIKRIIKHLYKAQTFNIRGFFTPEVRDHDKRIGFDLEDINSGSKIPFAREGNFGSNNKLGKYSVFTDKLDVYISTIEMFEEDPSVLFIIDEIGKMELFSNKFEGFIKKLFTNEFNILATIGQRLNHPIQEFVRNLPNIHFFILNRENQQEVFEKIKNLIIQSIA